MSHNRGTDESSASDSQRIQPSTRSSSEGQHEGERTPRPSTRREESNTSTRFDEPSPRYQPQNGVRTTSDHESTRLLSRDFAEQDPTHRLRHVRSTAISFQQPSIRRRYGSTQPSPSPGPSHSWRFMDSDRRSVAIAPSGTNFDTGSRKFSLAGPGPFEALNANQPYVDPGYAQLNPAYDQPANARPVWSLAKPLPHVLRPGMVPTKDELKDDVLQKEDPTGSVADLESGRIEPSLQPGKVAAQIDDVRRDRERLGLGSPDFSPYARPHRQSLATHGIPDIQSHLGEPIIEEDEEYRHRLSDPELSGLSGAVSKVNRAKEQDNESRLPYQDAIPLSAYEAEEDEVHNLHTYWSVVRLRFREPLAELLGVSFSDPSKALLTNKPDHHPIHARLQCQPSAYHLSRNGRRRRHWQLGLGSCHNDCDLCCGRCLRCSP